MAASPCRECLTGNFYLNCTYSSLQLLCFGYLHQNCFQLLLNIFTLEKQSLAIDSTATLRAFLAQFYVIDSWNP